MMSLFENLRSLFVALKEEHPTGIADVPTLILSPSEPVQYPLHQRPTPVVPDTRPWHRWLKEHPDAKPRYRPTTDAMPPVTPPVQHTDAIEAVQQIFEPPYPAWVAQLISQSLSSQPLQEDRDWLTAPMPEQNSAQHLSVDMLPEAIQGDPDDTTEVRAILKLKYSLKEQQG